MSVQFIIDKNREKKYSGGLKGRSAMNRVFISLFMLISVVLFPVNEVFAAFSVSLTPYEGGYDLSYGKVSGPRVNKEVTVNIISTIGKQYRLIQSLLEPISSPSGVSLSQNNFVVYGIRGTNKSGTLGVEQERPIGLGRDYIYTSSQDGLSDSFTLVYGLQGPFDVAPGNYRGRLSFTLEAIDSTQVPVTVFLDISTEIDVQSKIEIKVADGGSAIRLNPAREEEASVDVLVDIKGGMGSQFKIIQSVDDLPVSSEGNKLSEGAVKFLVKDTERGAALTTPTDLSLRPQTIYTSGLNGEAETFVITYSAGDLTAEKAGRYRSALKYILEGTGYIKQGLIATLDLEIDNARTFELTVTPEAGGVLRFQNLKAGSPPQVNEVVISVKSNIVKPYQITQKVLSPFTNKEGNVIPANYFTLRQESIDTKGILKFPIKTEAVVGDTVLFISDKQGSADTFKLIYELGIPPDLKAGDYSTTITYSLSEI